MPLPRFIQRLTYVTETKPGPIIILSAPRAGAAPLAHLLAQAAHALPLGLEARARAEAAVAPYRAAESDRMLAEAATPALSAELRQAMRLTPNTWTIDHAGTYALRVPFLAAALPEARFVMLARDPREQIARTIAAWRSGRYVTYPALAGWDGPWSFALMPGWEELCGRSLAEIALAQWATITATVLDDLAMLPDERWYMVRYESLRADIRGTMRTLEGLKLHWRRHPRMVETLATRSSLDPADLAAVDLLLPRAGDVIQRLRATMRARGLVVEDVPHRSGRVPGPLRRNLMRGSVAAALLGATLPAAQPAQAASFSVTNLNDSGGGSLRQALVDANVAAGADVITFDPGLAGTITLTSGQLVISDTVDIQGPGASTLSVSGNNASRVFYLYNGSAQLAATISGLTITGGNANIGGGIINLDEDLTLDGVTITGNTSSGDGAGLWADGFNMDLTIRNSIISGNTSGDDGGGIYIEDTGGPLLIQNTQITGNTAADKGGGIYFYDPDNTITIETSTISGNTAGGTGGGIYLYSPDNGAFTIRTTTVSGNTAASGGGIFLYNPDHGLLIENSTISGNQAISGDGGGIYFYNLYNLTNATISHTTIVGNTATGAGGGVMVHDNGLLVTHTIIADNTAVSNNDIGNDPGGSFNLSFSLVEISGTATITDTVGNIFSQDPQLGPLADNGGLTETHLPAATSPAIDAGDPAFVAPPATDQRGGNRVIGSAIDIGAVEVNPSILELAVSSLDVNENGVSATLTVTRTGGLDNAATVDYATTNGSASAGTDYTATNGTLSWANGDGTPRTITIPITNDTTIEPNETLTVSLANPTGATLGATTLATVTIVNDDAPSGSLALTVSNLSVNENGVSATLTVARTGGSSGAATVDYATANGSASAGTDYTAMNGTLSWADGDATPRIITIPIANDTTVEPNETLTVSLSNPTGATLGATALATVTIVNDDQAASTYRLFLPIVAISSQPDLVVTSVMLTPNKTSFTAGEPVEIAVTITNQGKANAQPFWVDLYLEPAEEPTVNKTWNMVCKLQPCYGIAWGVVQQLAPGQSVTLTSAVSNLDGRYSNWKGYFARGTTRMVVLADSYNPANPAGAVSESNETNNARSVTLSVTGANPTITEASDPATAIPERPRIP